MLISALPSINYNYYKNTNRSVKKQNSNVNNVNNTVSFCAKLPANTFFMDALARGYDTAEPTLISTAKEFHKALKNAVSKLKAYGFGYDEVYNSKCPIKRKSSVLDKYERQGSAQDMIRGTVYWQDQQDVMGFKKFLDAMKEDGWELDYIMKQDPATKDFIRNKNGSIIKFPDLEIRQEGVTQETLAPLGEFIQRADISKPRASTYSDWQARFVKSKGKSKSNVRHSCEVIFLYGQHYKDAKEIEHQYVYEPIRKLKKLHVDMDIEHHQKGSAGHTIVSHFNEIQKRLVQFISQPLFVNAFNADLMIKDAEKLPVEISKNYANLLMNYHSAIKRSINKYYTEMSKYLLKDEQIVDSIKASPLYQFRKDKTIFPKEIKDAKREIKARLIGWKEKDATIIAEVENMLKDTIDKFIVKD